MDGLIIKRQWLDLILSGKKTLEIRGSDTKKVGEAIYLLESGTHRVRGNAGFVQHTLYPAATGVKNIKNTVSILLMQN